MLNWLHDPRLFARGWAAILLALVVFGITLEFVSGGKFLPGLLQFDWTHDLLHVGLLALAIYMGWSAPRHQAILYARTFGIAGMLIALLGAIPATQQVVAQTTGMHLEVLETIVHALIAAWGLVAGFRTLPPTNSNGVTTVQA